VDDAFGFLELRGRAPRQQVWSCVNAQPVPDDHDACAYLIRQSFTEPVDFERTVGAMHAAGVRTFIDLGGGSLAQLTGEILAGLPYVSIAAAHHARDGASSLQRALLALWATHRDVDPNALDALASSNATYPTYRPHIS
jgi:malonyl CoA-acyl carrier protein transacylase